MDVDHHFDDVAATAVMVPMLPCGDVDAMVEFWSALGLDVTYRQLRPDPYIALGRAGITLHYCGMPDWDPAESHRTCSVAVPTPLRCTRRSGRGFAGSTARCRLPVHRA